MRVLRDLTLVVLVLGGAVGASQVPRFVQEYEQRLGGALQEATRAIGRYQDLAGGTGDTVGALSRRLAASADPATAGVGRAIGEQVGRSLDLRTQADALAGAGRFTKPFVLAQRHDRDLLAAAWAKYAWTPTLDPGFAVAGVLAGIGLNAVLWGIAAVPGRLLARATAR